MKVPILILHGWAATMTGAKYIQIQKALEQKGYAVFVPDLPGFGKEKLMKPAMYLDDYVLFVKTVLEKKKITKVILLGHSFGGRIATKFALQYPQMVEKLILTGAPLIKHPLSLRKKIYRMIGKIGKIMARRFSKSSQNFLRKILYRAVGQWDYYKAGELRETFINIIDEDLFPHLSRITVPTFLVWGEEDKAVSLEDAKKIAAVIPHARLTSIPGVGHKAPYENAQVFLQKLLPLLSQAL